MDINQKLLSVLEHCYKTNVEYVEDGEIVPGVTPDEVLKMIEMLQPVKEEGYKKLLEDTQLTMDVHVHKMMDDIDAESDYDENKYDISIVYGDQISRLPLNADLYSDLTTVIQTQLGDWTLITD